LGKGKVRPEPKSLPGYGVGRESRVEEKEDVREALETALATDGPFVLDFRIERA